MKKVLIPILLALVLLPIIWNGIGLLHYLVEHTHTFCLDESNHTHPTAEECLAIFQITPNQSQQIPTTTDFQELKQYLALNQYQFSILVLSYNQTIFIESPLLECSFSADIFHPPNS